MAGAGSIRRLNRPVAVLAFTAFVSQVGVAVMLPLLPLYAVSLGATPFVLGLLTTGFALTNAVGQLVAGFLADRFGSRRLVPSGMTIYAGANLLIATAASAVPLIAYRALAGLGGGIALSAERIYIVGAVDASSLGFANGVLSAGGSAGQLAGPAVGGLIAAVTDLRMPFLLVGLTSTIAAVAAMAFLPRVVEGAASRPAGDGTAVARQALRLAPIVALTAANVAIQAGFGAFITTYGPFATTVLGWQTYEVGLLFSVFALGDITLGPWVAHLGDRHGRRNVAILGCLPVALFSALLTAGASRPILFASAAVAGAGLTAFFALWYALLAGEAPPDRRGRIIGTVSSIGNLGIAAGAMLAAQLWERVDIRAGVGVAVLAVLAAAVSLLGIRPAARAASAGDGTSLGQV